MNEFLQKICEILGWMEEQRFSAVRSSADDIQKLYNRMDDKTQDICLKMLMDNMELDNPENMLFLSFLFKTIRSDKLQYMIE